MSNMECVVVTGANRGIGLELVRQLLSRGARVLATTRNGSENPGVELKALARESLSIFPCDMRSQNSIATLARLLRDEKITGVINNAGVWGHKQSADKMDFTEAAAMYQVNALAPLQLSLALRAQLAATKGKLMHVTSGLSSIGEENSGGNYGYRMSKAALNMMSRTLATDLRADGIASSVVDPGWVKTDMGGSNAPTEVADSARGILVQFDKLSLENSGHFVSFRGDKKMW
jgi:NAD(P)-dependent dehydrogenase (short-subunit alcohol dehydrogenase family)